jgi:hypothetical protein
VFGGLGLAIFPGQLAYEVFENSHVLGLALSAIGMALIGLALIGTGVLFHRRQTAIGAWLERALPAPLLRPHRARAG